MWDDLNKRNNKSNNTRSTCVHDMIVSIGAKAWYFHFSSISHLLQNWNKISSLGPALFMTRFIKVWKIQRKLHFIAVTQNWLPKQSLIITFFVFSTPELVVSMKSNQFIPTRNRIRIITDPKVITKIDYLYRNLRRRPIAICRSENFKW